MLKKRDELTVDCWAGSMLIAAVTFDERGKVLHTVFRDFLGWSDNDKEEFVQDCWGFLLARAGKNSPLKS